MSTTVITLIDILKNQGFSFLLMGAMLYWLNDQLHTQKAEMREEMKALKVQVDACNKANQDLLLNHLNRNTELLKLYEQNHQPRHQLRQRDTPVIVEPYE